MRAHALTSILGAALAIAVAAGCGGTSYGISKDGTFPPRGSGDDYPNWEHMCKVVSTSDVSETLNDAGTQGFELVALANHGGKDMMCFKRPKAPSSN